jgi:hypothetical protein
VIVMDEHQPISRDDLLQRLTPGERARNEIEAEAMVALEFAANNVMEAIERARNDDLGAPLLSRPEIQGGLPRDGHGARLVRARVARMATQERGRQIKRTVDPKYTRFSNREERPPKILERGKTYDP